MKQMFARRNQLLVAAFLIFLSAKISYCENLKSNEKNLAKRLRVDDYYERPVIIPATHYHHDDHIIHVEPGHYNTQQVPNIIPIVNSQPQQIFPLAETCPCINEVKCPPCGVVIEPLAVCPCAPKPSCPVCPPLSLIHEIAAKKARQDQILTSNLIGLSSQISSLLNNITKFAQDVAKYELEAKDAARKMEEASLKAQFAKKKMFETSEKARIIAKSTLMSGPCIGCPPDHLGRRRPVNPMWYGTYNRIFPDEVSNVGKYMGANFNSNFNPQVTSLNQSEEIAKLAEGKVNVLPLGVKASSVNLSRRKKKMKLL